MPNMENEDKLNNEKFLFNIKCDNGDEFILNGRPCELSAFSYVPLDRKYEPSERSIYQTKKDTFTNEKKLNYDNLFNINYNFDNKVHRDDRKHAKLLGLDAWSEEVFKTSPTRSSSEYGKHIVSVKNKIFSQK